jgi:hypothetical protein
MIRFNIPGDNDGDSHDGDIFDRVDQLKITLWRAEGGGVVGSFQIDGNFGTDPEEFAGGTAEASDLRFMRRLLERFEKVKE